MGSVGVGTAVVENGPTVGVVDDGDVGAPTRIDGCGVGAATGSAIVGPDTGPNPTVGTGVVNPRVGRTDGRGVGSDMSCTGTGVGLGVVRTAGWTVGGTVGRGGVVGGSSKTFCAADRTKLHAAYRYARSYVCSTYCVGTRTAALDWTQHVSATWGSPPYSVTEHKHAVLMNATLNAVGS